MNLRAEQTAAHLAARRAMMGAAARRRPRRKLPLQVPPRTIEREYAAEILRLLALVRTELRPLLEEMPRLLARAQEDRLTVDAAQFLLLDPRLDPTARADAGEGKRIRELIAAARDRLRGSLSNESLDDLAEKFARRTSTYQRMQLGRQLQAAIGIDVLMTDRKLGALVQGFVGENVALIRDVPDRLIGEVERATTRAVATGALHGDLAAELEQKMGIAEDRAALIARDQVGKLYGQINAARQTELGVERFVWRTVQDERVRDEHRELEGEIFSYADGGHPEEGLPGEPINCRCFAEPVLDELLEGL